MSDRCCYFGLPNFFSMLPIVIQINWNQNVFLFREKFSYQFLEQSSLQSIRLSLEYFLDYFWDCFVWDCFFVFCYGFLKCLLLDCFVRNCFVQTRYKTSLSFEIFE